ncbi:hypothetical protein [Vibrio agarivorans]|uniref:hypothetical protein n=1 Tax=Vibrio agarivorans TaxID=153622 RepID=UPI0025B3C37D|nr:hypothetical protein [Vibrio agarivorans]MDN3663554.1 hypothetical protein [Vibrio agarivorans]
MSSNFTHLAWSYPADKAEDKLLLLALAEISDRKGHFETSISELSELTSLSEGAVKTILRHFTNAQVRLVKFPPRENNRSSETFIGTLSLNGQPVPTAPTSIPVVDSNLMELAREQNERLNQNKQNNKGKLNRSQRSQIAPLHRSSNEKQYNVLQIHMEEIPEWAEGLMFKKGVHGRKEIWDSLVKDVHATGEKVFTQNQLINRLHQKIDYFKNLSFGGASDNTSKQHVKQSALSIFEDKYRDHLYDED